MNTLKLFRILAVAIMVLGLSPVTFAEGDPMPTYQREAAMQKYKNCKFTDEMGKYLYECVKKNDGFGTHWCFDEALETYCPKPTAKNDAQGVTTPGAGTNTQ